MELAEDELGLRYQVQWDLRQLFSMLTAQFHSSRSAIHDLTLSNRSVRLFAPLALSGLTERNP
jgi:hypothetical protein